MLVKNNLTQTYVRLSQDVLSSKLEQGWKVVGREYADGEEILVLQFGG